MKIKYHLPLLTREQRLFMEYLLLDEIEKQTWYSIVFLNLWKTESFICIQ